MAEPRRTSLLGSILTAASVLIAAGGLTWSWYQDRQVVVRSQAQEVRATAAAAIAALDRIESLSMLLFDEMQPLYVDASERVAAEQSVVAARDFLWSSINMRKLVVLRSLAQEAAEEPIARLYAYHPSVYASARQAMASQRRIFEEVVSELLADTEQDVLSFEDELERYQTAMLGNALRHTADRIRSEYAERSEASFAELRQFLASLVQASDERLVERVLLPQLP